MPPICFRLLDIHNQHIYQSPFRISYLKQAQVEGYTRKAVQHPHHCEDVKNPTGSESSKAVDVRGSSARSGYLPLLMGNFVIICRKTKPRTRARKCNISEAVSVEKKKYQGYSA